MAISTPHLKVMAIKEISNEGEHLRGMAIESSELFCLACIPKEGRNTEHSTTTENQISKKKCHEKKVNYREVLYLCLYIHMSFPCAYTGSKFQMQRSL